MCFKPPRFETFYFVIQTVLRSLSPKFSCGGTNLLQLISKRVWNKVNNSLWTSIAEFFSQYCKSKSYLGTFIFFFIVPTNFILYSSWSFVEFRNRSEPIVYCIKYYSATAQSNVLALHKAIDCIPYLTGLDGAFLHNNINQIRHLFQ